MQESSELNNSKNFLAVARFFSNSGFGFDTVSCFGGTQDTTAKMQMVKIIVLILKWLKLFFTNITKFNLKHLWVELSFAHCLF